MSRGVLDQAAYDASCKAAAWAEARGLKATMTAIHRNPDGTRDFRFRYDPAKPRKAKAVDQPPSMTHDPDAVWDRARESARGAARDIQPMRQGSLL